MARKLDDISRSRGSIRIGSTGTIGSLMNKELESSSFRTSPRPPLIDEAHSNATGTSVKLKSPEIIKQTAPKRQKASAEEASGSREGNIRKSPELSWKTKSHAKTHRMPMLGSENAALDKTPKRDKPVRKVSIVEVVDSNCGVPSGSLSNRLKKLGFSKLSQSII